MARVEREDPERVELRRRIHQELEASILDAFRWISLLLGLYFLALAPLYWLDATNPHGRILTGASILAAAILAGLNLLLGRRPRPIATSEGIALLLIGLPLAHLLFHVYLSRDLMLTSDLMMVVMAAGLGLHRWRAYLPSLGGTLLLWAFAAWRAAPHPHLLHWAIGMATATLGSIAFHIFILGIIRRQKELRLKDLLREREIKALLQDLRSARAEVAALEGLVPICAWCRQVRKDDGYWQQVEAFIQDRGLARFTHGICPSCEAKMAREEGRGQVSGA